jgi:hypothetical protein
LKLTLKKGVVKKGRIFTAESAEDAEKRRVQKRGKGKDLTGREGIGL